MPPDTEVVTETDALQVLRTLAVATTGHTHCVSCHWDKVQVITENVHFSDPLKRQDSGQVRSNPSPRRRDQIDLKDTDHCRAC